jgi:hypothetical protein
MATIQQLFDLTGRVSVVVDGSMSLLFAVARQLLKG